MAIIVFVVEGNRYSQQVNMFGLWCLEPLTAIDMNSTVGENCVLTIAYLLSDF